MGSSFGASLSEKTQLGSGAVGKGWIQVGKATTDQDVEKGKGFLKLMFLIVRIPLVGVLKGSSSWCS
jgi:hypothetical protein